MSAHKTLLLNSSYEPMKVISWQKAITLWFADKVEIVEEYNDVDLTTVSFSMKCPSVVRLRKYVKGSNNNRVKFSRMNLFSRDNFTCQYCGSQPGVRHLTYDHVLPKSRGGKTSWENIVTACLPCNSKKADRTPDEARMGLKSKPFRPHERPDVVFTLSLPKTPEAWKNYIIWNSEISNE